MSLLGLPKALGADGEAKLVIPALGCVAPKPPLNPENPDPRAEKPEEPAAAANPVAAGFPASVVSGDLKTDVVELPNEPKGDFSEPEKAARLDEAKADEDVVAAGFVSSSFFAWEAPSDPKGETVEVLANALVTGA